MIEVVISKLIFVIIGSLILMGSLLSLITSIGLIRLPDLYTRSHAASKSATLGVMSVLLGVFIYFWFDTGYMNVRLLLGIVFVFFTSPVAGHLISRAAYNSKVKLWEKSIQDDLKDKANHHKSI